MNTISSMPSLSDIKNRVSNVIGKVGNRIACGGRLAIGGLNGLLVLSTSIKCKCNSN